MRPPAHARVIVTAALFTALLALGLGLAAAASAVDPGYPLWMRSYGGSGNQYFRGVASCPGGDLVVIGTTGEAVNHLVVARYSSAGKRRWLKVIDPTGSAKDAATAIVTDRDGNAVVLGTRTLTSGASQMLVCKYSAKGRRLWKRTLDGGAGGTNTAAALALNRTGDTIVTGNATFEGAVTGSLTARLRARDGKILMRSVQTGVGALTDSSHLAVDGRGYIYVTGSGDRGDGLSQLVTVKLRPAGTVAWSKAVPGAGTYRTLGERVVLAGGSVYVAARQRSASPLGTVIVLRYATSGALKWRDDLDVPGGQVDVVNTAAADRFGNFFVAGSTGPLGMGPSHAFVARWSTSRARWTYVEPSADLDSTSMRGLVVDQAGGCWTAGAYAFTPYDPGGGPAGIYTTRISKTGALRWEQIQIKLGGNLHPDFDAVTACSGGIAVAGSGGSPGAYDALLMKFGR